MGEYARKVVMLGDPAVGKTSLVRRFVSNMFDDRYLGTIGAKPSKKVVQIGEDRITLVIWDIAGVSSRSVHPSYYAGAKGALIVSDLTRRATMESIEWWRSNLSKSEGSVPFIVLANKSDLPDWEFDIGEIESPYIDPMRTSAKTGEHVEKTFHDLAEMIIYD
ncbi:MAG: Rab family GTPase [Candidatus Thermoplasmatota archaeon]